ncbi:hypothetical protein ACN47A_35325 [Myxococcus fulvus]|uniref:hypothetical protein n=1 Tax=Myxococcus fulvus TaxID=33 RepID=UPI003B9BF90C
MRDVVDAGKRALATHRGVEFPHRAECLRGERAQHLSAAPGGCGVSNILRTLVSRDSELRHGERLHGDEALCQDVRHLDNVRPRMSHCADLGIETDSKPRSCSNDLRTEADWTHRHRRATSHDSLQEV